MPCVKATRGDVRIFHLHRDRFRRQLQPHTRRKDGPLRHGRIVLDLGWVEGDCLGIDQGPIAIMTENHRSHFLWGGMRREPNLRRGLQRAGFTSAWLSV